MTSVRILISSLLIGFVLLCGMGTASAQLISVQPQSLTFVYQMGGPNPGAQNLSLNASVPTQFSVTISGAPWLSVSPSSGVTPGTLVATVTPPANATPGTLSGSIIIGPVASVDAIKSVVSVNLQILAPPQGNLVAAPSAVSFSYQTGGPFPAPTPVSITSTGSAASFNLTTSANWLYVVASSYVTPATVQVSANPTGMAPGTYNGAVYVNPTYAGGSAAQISVTLRISAAGNLVANPTYLAFNYQPGGPHPVAQVLNIVNSTGGVVGYTATCSTTGFGPWLSCTPTAGNTPGTVTVAVSPVGLSAGTFNGTVTINPTTGGLGSTQIPVTLTVFSQSQLVVSPSSLIFNYQAGNPTPLTQYLSINSTSSPVNYTLTVQGPSWVTVYATGGTTPSGVGVSAAPSSTTPPGTYTGNITVIPSNGGGSAVSVPLTVNVTSANYLTISRTGVSFDSTTGGTNPPPVIVSVGSSGPALHFEAVAATAGFQPWLNVSQSSQYTPANVTIGVAPQGLAAGAYSGTVVISADGASNGPQTIAVTLVVTTSTSLTATPFGLVYSYQMGMDPPDPQVLVVSAQGNATSFTVTTKTNTGGNWLLGIGNGPTPSAVAVGVNGSGLGTGTYTGQVVITSADPLVPVLEVPVVFNVSPNPIFQPGANQVSFQYQINGPTPKSQGVAINTNGLNPAVFYPTVMAADGGTWLSVSPDVGATPTSLIISVNPKDMRAGSYYGLIAINDPSGAIPISFVPVSLQVSDGPILTVAHQTLVFGTQTGMGNLQPLPVAIGGTGRTNQFQVSTSGGSWLSAAQTSGTTDAVINVTANPNGLAPGYYLGVVSMSIPGTPNSVQSLPVVLVVAPGF